MGIWGYKFSEASRKKMSESKKRFIADHPEYVEQIRLRSTGRKQSRETIEKRVSHFRGKKRDPEVVARIKAKIPRGERNHFWRGGVSSAYYRARRSADFKHWRSAVFERDNWTCQFCGVRGGTIQAHHQIPFSYIFKNRSDNLWDIGNGVTLCLPCHKLTPTFLVNNETLFMVA